LPGAKILKDSKSIERQIRAAEKELDIPNAKRNKLQDKKTSL
jgi:hypothetical protein